MKLDVNALRYLERDDFRVLTAVELGMKNHELVPAPLVTQIAGLRLGGINKILGTLLRHKLLHHDRQTFDGYRLTYLGYDFLALRTFVARGVLEGIGSQIGVGKESDIFAVCDKEGETLCLKMHRLGRTSFRAIKNKRDYHGKRGSPSWLYLSRLAATKEQTFMKVLSDHGFPVPKLIEANRHAILMSLVDGFNLQSVKTLEAECLEETYLGMMDIITRFARHGLIHGDFNEFNVMISSKGKLTVIDFPQIVSTRHPNARMYFERDVNCVTRFFRKRFNFFHEHRPNFDDCVANIEKRLDVLVSASGFSQKMSKELSDFIDDLKNTNDDDVSEEDSDDLSETDDAPEKVRDKTDNTDDQSNSSSVGVEIVKAADVSQDDRASVPPSKECVSDELNEGINSSEIISDSPDAYLAYDFVAGDNRNESGRLLDPDDIRRRVRRDFTRKGKQAQKHSGNKFKRNVGKNREKRVVNQEIKNGGC